MKTMKFPHGFLLAAALLLLGAGCQFEAPVSPPVPPTPGPTAGGDCSGPGDTCPKGYQCIQKCGPPVVREGEPPPGWYCETDEIAAKPRMCPICLALDTRISTPTGDVRVQDVKIGMPVWSVDTNGEKIVSVVKDVSRSAVPTSHRVVHLVLNDQRELWVSPDHPTVAGGRVGDLQIGETYDGSRVTMAQLVPYWSDATYDVVPDSESGFYWADGILMGSTLKEKP